MAAGLALAIFLISAAQEPEAPARQEASSSAPYVERNQKQFSFYPGGKLQIDAGVPGNVKVIGWQRASVLVEYERIVYGLAEDKAKTLASQYPVQVRWGKISGTIRTVGPPGAAAAMEINLTLHVPKEKTDLNIRITKGDLGAGVINGWIEATLLDGSIDARSLNGYFSGTTRQGDIYVEMAGKRWDGYGFTGVTQRGSIQLQLPPDYSAALQLDTREGNITIDYPEQLVEGESVPLTAVTRKKARSLTATVGDGGAPIKLATVSGEIALSTKKMPESGGRP
jgi:hypothetical protein